MLAKRGRRGFTIVELLIVIVVIAILAATTIVAFNGIQQRARNTQVITGANAYYKAFLEYKSVNLAYPSVAGCLGANYPSNACWMNDTTPSQTVNATLDSQLSEFVPQKPTLATQLMSIGIGTYNRAGLVYLPGDATYGFRFAYYLQGTGQNCAIQGAVAVNEGGVVTQCNISLP